MPHTNSMKNFALSLTLCVGIGLFTLDVVAAEYDDADMLPRVISLSFAGEQVGFEISVAGFSSYEFPLFVHNSSDNSIRSVSATEYASLFGEGPEPLADHFGNEPDPYVTTDGTTYEPHHCSGYDDRVISEMVIADQRLVIDFEECIAVSEIELDGDIVWMGTYYAGGHGDSGGRGLLAISRKSGQIVARIDTGGYPISHVRYDSFSNNVWVITDDQVVVVDKNMEVVTRYFFYYEFDPRSGKPVVKIANTWIASHPMAVFAMHLPSDQYQRFYESVQSIPDEKAREYDLQDLYMCCYFAPPGKPSQKPREFEILVPFLLPAFQHTLESWSFPLKLKTKQATRMWRQVACKHRSNDHAARLCDIEDWGELIKLERSTE
jgi:hypothetical protein